MNRIIPFFLGSAFGQQQSNNQPHMHPQQGYYPGPYQPMPYNPMMGEYPPFYPPYNPYVRR